MNTGTPLLYKPFRMKEYGDISVLEALPVEKPATPRPLPIIEERQGLHYISQAALDSAPNTARDLNQDFKDLVNSILN
jgi:hypothetical protein